PHALERPSSAAPAQMQTFTGDRGTARIYHGARCNGSAPPDVQPVRARAPARRPTAPATRGSGGHSNCVLRFLVARSTPRPKMRIAKPLVAASFAVLSTFAVFAVDVAVRDPVAEAKGAGGWLGVAMEASKGKPGVLVTHVIRTSPAEKAGLKLGDRIVK